MSFSQFFILSLLILFVFGIGDTVFKTAKINKWFVIIALCILEGVSFLPVITTNTFQLSIYAFVLPVVLGIFACVGIKNRHLFVMFMISILLTTTLMLMYSSFIMPYVPEHLFFQPYLILALIIGVINFLLSKSIKIAFSGAVFGGVLQLFISYGIANQSSYVYLNMGGEYYVAILLTSFLTMMVTQFFYRKIRLLEKRKQRKKVQQERN